MAYHIFVVGGVNSGTGKGVAAASIGLLLKLRGFKVQLIKCDPYLNVNAGILAPREHGECFLCDDGTETDLDLGHYERIAGITVSNKNICTSGTLYKELIQEQEEGKWLGETIQVIPHVTDKIAAKLDDLGTTADVVITEIGGTVGDLESGHFYATVRKYQQRKRDEVLVVLVAPILWVPTIGEYKTKPLQNSVMELQRNGIHPDILLCRMDHIPEESAITNGLLDKIACATGVPRTNVFDAPAVETIYQVPIELYDRELDDLVSDLFSLPRSTCKIRKFRQSVEKFVSNELPPVTIGVVGKYSNASEAYLSLKEALMHAGLANDLKVNVKWIVAEDLESHNMRGIQSKLEDLDGIIVPGGFDSRGVEGKIKAIRFAREKGVPFLGLCLGLQCAVIEYARNVCSIADATSAEFDKSAEHPVIHYVAGQESIKKKSATMRLGSYDCELIKGSLAHRMYGAKLISERHRHRLEVNEEYVKALKKAGLVISGRNPQNDLVEMIELAPENHPYFIATQSHPEFKSKLLEPAPLFNGLVKAAKDRRDAREKVWMINDIADCGAPYYLPFAKYGEGLREDYGDSKHQLERGSYHDPLEWDFPDELADSILLAVFCGGVDVDPVLYDAEPHPATQSPNSNRDQHEKAVALFCLRHNIPMVGICRGAQFLCVFDEGKLVQHVPHHGRSHAVYLADAKEKFMVNSLHHQMQLPREGNVLLAYSLPSQGASYQTFEYAPGHMMYLEMDMEPEAVHYTEIKGLGIQWHPEIMSDCDRGVTFMQDFIEKELLDDA